MDTLKKIKNKIAFEKGYPNWDEYENWLIDTSQPVVVAQLLVGAMEKVCIEYGKNCNSENLLLLMERLKSKQTQNTGRGMRSIDYYINCVETTINLLEEKI